MSKRATELAFQRMADAAHAAGMDTRGWTLETGTPSMGIAWKIYTPAGSTALIGMPPFGHIGKTAREAEHFLAGMVAAFESINYAKPRKGE